MWYVDLMPQHPLFITMGTLGGFCATPLWNETISWNSGNPYLTECFEHLVLVTASCVVLWVLAPFEFFKISKKHGQPNPWTKLNITKFVLKVILLLICLVDISRHTYGYVTKPNYGLDGLVAAIIYTVTIVLTLALAHFARIRGALITLSLPSFWLLATVTTLISMYTEIRNFEHENWNNTLGLVDDTLVVVISLVQLVLSCFSEKPAPPSRTSFRSVDFCPVENAPLPSRITFSWMLGLFAKGLKNSLHQDHLIPLCSELKSSSSAKKFREILGKYRGGGGEIDSGHADHRNEQSNLIESETSEDSTHPELNENNGYFWLPDEELVKSDVDQSLLWILIKSNKKFLLISSFLELLSVALFYVPPYILSLFLDYIEKDSFKWHGYVIAVALFLSVMVSSILDSQQKYYNLLAAVQVKAALVNAVYSKVFRLSMVSKESHSIGSIGNYISVDTEKVFRLVNICTQLWSVPLRITLGFYFLWIYLGASCMMSLAVLAVMVLITWTVILAVSKLQKRRISEKDKRLSVLSEIFHGIKVLKLYAWEEPFLKKVYNIRQKELSYLRKAEYLDICFNFLFSIAPSLVALASFATYLLINKNHFLDANMVFVSLSVINLLRFPSTFLLVIISSYSEARIAMSRLHKFLQSDELDYRAVGCNPDNGDSATIRNGSFSYSQGLDPILKNISLKVKENKLVAVIGAVGSGKSSLINALLGEMYKIDGAADIKGSVAYVAQQPWLQNATLEQNILFMSEMNRDFYLEVLEACALLPDTEMLPAGDHTEIGEQGINLTDGQKQRVSLARAVYQNTDFYLLDDPLSSIDPTVATNLFQRVLGPQGLLKNKTRLLVTHNHSFLPQVDWIVVMKNGSIAEQGTYEDLLNADGILSIYMADVMLGNGTGDSVSLEDSTSLLEMNLRGSEVNMSIENVTPSSDVDNDQLIEEENTVGIKDPWNLYISYIQNIGCFPSMFAVLVAGLYCASEMATGVWLSDWSDDYKSLERNYRLTVYACFVLSQGLFVILSDFVLFTGSSMSASKMHRCLLLHVIRAPQTFFDTTPTGRILNRFGKDMESVDAKIPRTLNIWMCAVLWIPAVFVVISFASLYITIAFLPLILIYYVVQKLYISTSRQLRHLTSTTSSPLCSHFGESLVGVTSIRAFKTVKYFISRFHERLDTHLNCFFLYKVSSRWLEVCLNILGSFVVLITAILVVSEQEKGSGIIGLALVYSMQIAQGLSVLIRLSSRLETSMVAFERIKEYSEVKQEAEWRNPVYQPLDSWPQEGAISIQNLSTMYRERFSPVLHDINITVKPGEKVAIVGKTGAGKSALALTLFRLVEPTEGAVFVDNINILCIGLHNLRSKLTFLPQDPVIFTGTIRSNLDPFCVHNDEDLWKSLDEAHLRSHVLQLSGGLDHYISKGGESLSFGQCQLLCLARCVLRKSKVFVLDKAPVSVDVELDCLIQETIKTAFADCTVISVVRCLSSVMDYSRVIVLACGEVVEDGCPKELILDVNSYFYNLAVDAGLVATNDQYNPAVATNDQYNPAVATNDQYNPAVATNDQYNPAVATNDQYNPVAATSDQYNPVAATSDQYNPVVVDEIS